MWRRSLAVGPPNRNLSADMLNPRSTRNRAGWLVPLVTAISLVAVPAVVAQNSPCDPDIARNSTQGMFGYQDRGAHCEGLFATDVAATMMWVASLTATF